jgi:transposase
MASFVPAIITPEPPTQAVEPVGGRAEIVSANGRRIIFDRDADIGAVLRLVRGLETLL